MSKGAQALKIDADFCPIERDGQGGRDRYLIGVAVLWASPLFRAIVLVEVYGRLVVSSPFIVERLWYSAMSMSFVTVWTEPSTIENCTMPPQ
jgi:hypothetical protein